MKEQTQRSSEIYFGHITNFRAAIKIKYGLNLKCITPATPLIKPVRTRLPYFPHSDDPHRNPEITPSTTLL